MLYNLKSHGSQEEGAVLVIFAALLLPMILLTGMAIELTRETYVQTQLAYACDAGAIAAARYSSVDAQTNGHNFFNANFQGNNKANISVVPTFTISTDGNFITCQATGSMPTFLLPAAGFNNLNIDSLTQVQRITAPSEVALVLDNTGSMAQNSKMAGLITASNQLIAQLFPGGAVNPGIAVSVVPFVAAVNIGTANSAWVSKTFLPNLSNFTKGTPWSGCVMTPDTGLTMDSDAPPSATRLWPAYYTTSTCTNVLNLTTAAATCTTAKGDNNYSYTAGGTIKTYSPTVPSVGPNRSCGLPILPLSNDPKALTAEINKMVPIDGGGTFNNLGLAWGWNTISPKWTGLWSGGIPAQPYGKIVKSVVFITDGGNNWYSSGSITGDPTAYNDTFTAGLTSRIAAGTLGSTKAGICKTSNCRAQIDERTLDLCAKMKAQGIQIFTIGFGSGIDALAIKNLTACASKPEWYFTANDNTDLLNQFKTIGDVLLAIKVVK